MPGADPPWVTCVTLAGKCTATGTSDRFAFESMPSCPRPLTPQSRYLPSASRAPAFPNAATSATTWAEGPRPFTLTGTKLVPVVPLPSWPSPPRPHAQTRPADSYTAWLNAPATAVTRVNGSSTGRRCWWRLPRHSSPPPLKPQPQTCPVVSTAWPVSYGMTLLGSEAILTPAGKRTRTGLVKEFLVLPLPSWPWLPIPHAYTVPLTSSA